MWISLLTAPSSNIWTVEALLGFASRFHPVVVHFPIALCTAAALAELLAVFGCRWARSTSRFCIVLGAAGAIAAGVTGWLKFTYGPMAGVTPDDATNLHRWVGTIAGGVAVLAALFSLLHAVRPESKTMPWLYRFTLLAGAIGIGFTGHLGGLLVFGSDHFSFAE